MLTTPALHAAGYTISIGYTSSIGYTTTNGYVVALFFILFFAVFILVGISQVRGWMRISRAVSRAQVRLAPVAGLGAAAAAEIGLLQSELSAWTPGRITTPTAEFERAIATAWRRLDASTQTLQSANTGTQQIRARGLAAQGRIALRAGLGIRTGQPSPRAVLELAHSTSLAGNGPRPGGRRNGPVPESHVTPTPMVSLQSGWNAASYPGYGYGWYPECGWGWWNYDGTFHRGRLYGDALPDAGYGWGYGYGYDALWEAAGGVRPSSAPGGMPGGALGALQAGLQIASATYATPVPSIAVDDSWSGGGLDNDDGYWSESIGDSGGWDDSGGGGDWGGSDSGGGDWGGSDSGGGGDGGGGD